MTARWSFGFNCKLCGSDTTLAAAGVPSAYHTTALVVCDGCGARWQLTVLAERLSLPANKEPRQPCGTVTAYRRHYSRGEVPCDACKEANRQAKREARRHD